jgi:hypothetical protein
LWSEASLGKKSRPYLKITKAKKKKRRRRRREELGARLSGRS